jgi:hypothetical protein
VQPVSDACLHPPTSLTRVPRHPWAGGHLTVCALPRPVSISMPMARPGCVWAGVSAA